MPSPRALFVAAVLPVALTGCSSGGGTSAPTTQATPAASAPAPGVTLPPDALSRLVPDPTEVPAGMILVTKGSGPRTIDVVAGYSGAAAPAELAALKAHGFVKAYVGQYLNTGNGQVLSVVASTFATAAGATKDFAADETSSSGTKLAVGTLGEASSATTSDVPGTPVKQLVLLRFRRGTTTWSLVYEGVKPIDPTVAVGIAKALLARTVS